MSTEQTATENTDFRLRVFISYSRADTDFVDRLEADLRARDIYVWVDRQKLEGGKNWLDQIQEAIDKCNVMIAVLSPDFISSKFTKMEYEYGFTSDKQLLPVLHRPVEKVSIVLNNIQWATKFQHDYDAGLQELLVILGNYLADEQPISSTATIIPKFPQASTTKPIIHKLKSDWDKLVAPNPASTPQEKDLDELYRLGFTASTNGDLERAELYWGQVLQKRADFRNGYVRREWEKVHQKLNLQRVSNLFKQAYDAYTQGQFSREEIIWQAILKIDPDNIDAKLGLNIREQNIQNNWLYKQVKQFVRLNKLELAKEQLLKLFEEAPYYDDKDNLTQIFNIQKKGHPVHQKEFNHRLEQKQKIQAQQSHQMQIMREQRSHKVKILCSSLGAFLGLILSILVPLVTINFEAFLYLFNESDFAKLIIILFSSLFLFSCISVFTFIGWVFSNILIFILNIGDKT